MTVAVRPVVLLLFLFALPALSSTIAHAQGWTLHASAGRAVHDPVAAGVGTQSAVLGISYEGTRWLYLSAGLPFDSEGLPWGAAGLGGRFSTNRRLAFGLDVAGHGYGYRDPSATTGGGSTLEVLPLVALRRGSAELELRSGLLHHAHTYSGVTDARSIHQTDARVRLNPGFGLSVSGEGRYLRAEEDAYPYLGGTAALSHGRADVWAFAGKWLSEAIPRPVWGAGVAFRAGERLNAYLSFQQDTNDPLYWNTPRRSWTLGISHKLGRAGVSTPPAPILPTVVAGQVVLQIPVSEAVAAPFVAGDFTGWEPVPMTRSGDFWTAQLSIQPGVYRYAFRTADGKWFVPRSVPNRVDDGMGGASAVLVVPGPSS